MFYGFYLFSPFLSFFIFYSGRFLAIAPVQPTLSSNPGEIFRVMGRSAASHRSSEISSAHGEIRVHTWEVQ
ncbi:hypothetical protein TIFTF001_034202 [Ficus carica]|uniref:Uncharacterized protein n=1 Tax=Ficus carica TaxID=3494 RepID=A0AA88E2B6_FICCA|nr:hypothetical protein TIFTF001_034202 [Ficus carica]